jgi:hypothetical protein
MASHRKSSFNSRFKPIEVAPLYLALRFAPGTSPLLRHSRDIESSTLPRRVDGSVDDAINASTMTPKMTRGYACDTPVDTGVNTDEHPMATAAQVSRALPVMRDANSAGCAPGRVRTMSREA